MDTTTIQKQAEREVSIPIMLESTYQVMHKHISEIRKYMMFSLLDDYYDNYGHIEITDINEYLINGFFDDDEKYEEYNEYNYDINDDDYDDYDDDDSEDEEYEDYYEENIVVDCGSILVDAYIKILSEYMKTAKVAFTSKYNVNFKLKSNYFYNTTRIPKEIVDDLFGEYSDKTVKDIIAIYEQEYDNCNKKDCHCHESEFSFSDQFETLFKKRYDALIADEKIKERKRIEKEERKRKKAELEEKAKEGVMNRIPKRYADFFPSARKMNRHFVLHIGPTNSGKTFDAMQSLKASENGVYLGPLRLLAYEQYENMNADGFPCSLVTGEEKEIVDGARFCASTVEMCNIHKHYACAVVDEAQMVEDYDRGGAWTTAILGVCADEIHVCVAPEAEEVIIRMINECGDTYSIIRHERKTPLVVESDTFNSLKDVRKGDALIVFSRKNVHAVAAELQKKGIKCSVIYGSLPYDVRHNQAELFANGTNDVVVATDAIGMGMNLPIQRVVFLEQTKFDGTYVRYLTVGETKQIAGRAGRFGIYDIGYVSSANERKNLKSNLEARTPAISYATISFPESLLEIEAPLPDILKNWAEIKINEGYQRADPGRLIYLCEKINGLSKDKKFLYKCLTIPFDEREPELFNVWKEMCNNEAKGGQFPVGQKLVSQEKLKTYSNNMELLERKYKLYDLLYSYCDKFHHDEFVNQILEDKKLLSQMLIDLLKREKYSIKKCKCCGRILPWNYKYGMCRSCYNEQSQWYNYY